jgi:hypothetical protein
VTLDSSVHVKTLNVVAGIRVMVYRVNVDEDRSALVKAYGDEIFVANPQRCNETR